MTPLEQISKDTQKKQTKETYERDIRKRHTKKTDERDIRKRHTKETYERDIRKRHTKETDERDIRKIHTKETCIQRILIFVLPAQVRLNNMMKLLYLRNNFLKQMFFIELTPTHLRLMCVLHHIFVFALLFFPLASLLFLSLHA